MSTDNNKIRREIKSLRDAMDPRLAYELSGIITKRALLLDIIKDSSDFMIYKSFGNEVKTDGIIKTLLGMGKRVAFPITVGDDMIAAIPESDSFHHDRFGIEIPEKYALMDEPEVIFVPLIACDEKKNRIGFGKGYYDRYLSRVNALKIGLCYDFQIVSHIEKMPWDVPLDIILSEIRIIK